VLLGIFVTHFYEMTLGKSGSNRQKIPHSIEGMEKIQVGDDVDFATPGIRPARILYYTDIIKIFS
jgi:hypothetical protein